MLAKFYTYLSLKLYYAKSLYPNFQVLGMLELLGKRLREFHYSAIEIEEILNLVYLCVRQIAFVFNSELKA